MTPMGKPESGPVQTNGLTIYDVARHAGLSIASVSRVLNGRDNPRQETRDRVLRSVAALGYVPDGAARALSNRLKEVVGVVLRRVTSPDDGLFADEDESLLFADMINREVEIAAHRRGFDLLMSSVSVTDRNSRQRIFGVAGKCDGLILHDRVLTETDIERLAARTSVVTLAGVPTEESVNLRGDNVAGMRDLARHLVVDHGYRSVAYLAGHADSPDNLARLDSFAETAVAAGATCDRDPVWQGNYMASGGAAAVHAVLAAGHELPRAIACANDQAALGVIRALAEHGLRVPTDVAVTGFDDIPVARLLHPPLTTVRQPIRQLGATAFDVLHKLINGNTRPGLEVVLPTKLVIRESCGCDGTRELTGLQHRESGVMPR